MSVWVGGGGAWSFRGLEGLFFIFCMYKYIIQVTHTFRVVHNSLGSMKHGAAKHFFYKKKVNMGNKKEKG